MSDLSKIGFYVNKYALPSFLILGILGFIGNLFIYLQPKLRLKTCCIYLLLGSIADILNLLINVFSNYLSYNFNISIAWSASTGLCQLNLFLLRFFRQLPSQFLLLSILDRFAATCDLRSPIRRILQLKYVSIMSILAVISCFLLTITGIFFFQKSFFWCELNNPLLANILYIIFNGLLQPILMLIFVFLTYRNIHQSQQRTRRINGRNSRQYRTQFIVMIFGQIFITVFLSMQWIIYYVYYIFTLDQVRTNDQRTIVMFVFSISANIYYLISVKPFYISLLISPLFRKTFAHGLMKLSCHQRRRVGVRTLETSIQPIIFSRKKTNDLILYLSSFIFKIKFFPLGYFGLIFFCCMCRS